ncbi:MAG: FtsW/RodA/SpoVE family cell cycle protein [Planctomycetota bacterium]
MSLGDRLKRANWLLLGVGVLLALVGATTVHVASLGQRADYGAAQVRWVVLGVVACLLVLAVPYRRIVDARWFVYALGLLALVAVLVVGRGKSAGRWIQIGGFRAQPSELMKVVLVVMLAGYIRYDRSHRELRGLLRPLAITLVPVLLIMKQPDLGTALLLLPLLLVMLYAAGARRQHLGLVMGLGALAGLALFFLPGLMSGYQKDRVHAFLLQHTDDTMLQRHQLHHLHQSKTVVGTAGFLGTGLGEATADAVRYLPERHSDFIYPVYVMAFGTGGAVILFLLYALLVGLVLRVAMGVREPSGRLLCVGIAALFACQAIINLMMTVGLLPIVGMPLGFMSYGGSSLLTSFLALGLVLNVGADHPYEFGRGDFDWGEHAPGDRLGGALRHLPRARVGRLRVALVMCLPLPAWTVASRGCTGVCLASATRGPENTHAGRDVLRALLGACGAGGRGSGAGTDAGRIRTP